MKKIIFLATIIAASSINTMHIDHGKILTSQIVLLREQYPKKNIKVLYFNKSSSPTMAFISDKNKNDFDTVALVSKENNILVDLGEAYKDKSVWPNDLEKNKKLCDVYLEIDSSYYW
jgi:hypothetical protein